MDYNMPLLGLSFKKKEEEHDLWAFRAKLHSRGQLGGGGTVWTLAPSIVWPVLIEVPDIVLWMKALFVPLTSPRALYPQGL